MQLASWAVYLPDRRYFKRFPVDLPDEQEPTAEYLAAVDDDAIDPDYEEPDAEKLSPAEYREAMAKLGVRQKTLEFRRAQIKCWLAYQHMKDHDLNPTETGAHNLYRPLLFKLTGKGGLYCAPPGMGGFCRIPVHSGGIFPFRPSQKCKFHWNIAKNAYSGKKPEWTGTE
ncbi:hypothetical protein GALMADRAFT_140529 [Galerina marginata CBS 339.88]|uniref:Uncharacterized protein n=1 Tax=Galerina marginata (strain CBS 339.88) TaxID=685588 RepID=A0A067T0Z8_GALM3|nr:hypothetical protein GALMADRAFT_140529 [Galerina marginata CBS 339.88]